MAKVCNQCGRGPQVGLKRSKSMIGTKRKWHINLQTKKINNKRVQICTKCIKTQSKKARG